MLYTPSPALQAAEWSGETPQGRRDYAGGWGQAAAGGEGRRRRGRRRGAAAEGAAAARGVLGGAEGRISQVPVRARCPAARRGAIRHLLRFSTQIGRARHPVSAPRPGNAELHARPVRRIYKKGEVKPTAKLESIRFSLQPVITLGAGVYASTWPAVGLIQFEPAVGEGPIKSPSNLHQITGRRSAAARRSSG